MSDARSFVQRLQESWYQSAEKRFYYLQPLSWLFGVISGARRIAYQSGWLTSWKAPVPVIVVGNITVGGTGKTPVVIALIDFLKSNGYKPGVVSRGYGGSSSSYPLNVSENTSPLLSGDEPALIAARCRVPVVVDPDRVAAVKHLLASSDCDIVIADDGLQHYALRRDIEIAVVDSVRGMGNGHLMPVGPLRESVERLKSVFFIVLNGNKHAQNLPDFVLQKSGSSELKPDGFVQLQTGAHVQNLPEGKSITAIAGIGNPERFFSSLSRQNIKFHSLAFPDHYAYQRNDLEKIATDIIVMTEKDAVKCRSFSDDRIWYQPVSAQLPDTFSDALLKRLSTIKVAS